MFRKKVKEDPTELELLKIRVRNLEKQVAELKKAPQVQAEELDAKFLSCVNFLSNEFEYIEIQRESNSEPIAVITKNDVEVIKDFKAVCKPY